MTWFAIASYTDVMPGVPNGKILVIATKEGARDRRARRRRFLVNAREYNSGPRPFPVDPNKHEEITQ